MGIIEFERAKPKHEEGIGFCGVKVSSRKLYLTNIIGGSC
jgi:hypothetical protein